MDNKDIKYWVGFSLIPGIGRVKLAQLENYFDSLEDAWQAVPADLKRAGLDSGSINAITLWLISFFHPLIASTTRYQHLRLRKILFPQL